MFDQSEESLEADEFNIDRCRDIEARKKRAFANARSRQRQKRSQDSETGTSNKYVDGVVDNDIGLEYISSSIDLKLEELPGRPDILAPGDWCQHLTASNKHFKVVLPTHEPSNKSFENKCAIRVYNILSRYILIKDCKSTACIKNSSSSFIENGFTSSKKNGGRKYNVISQDKKTQEDLTAWVLAIKFLKEKELALVHPNGCIYRFIPDFRCKDSSDISNVKLLFLKGSPDEKNFRNFLCLGCHSLSKQYSSNRSELFDDHCKKYHAVKSRGILEEKELLYYNTLLSFIIDNGATLDFVTDNYYTGRIIERLGLSKKSFHPRKVRQGLININQIALQSTIDSAVDTSFNNLLVDKNDPQLYELILKTISKIHTFVCITEDVLKDERNSYESVTAHFTKLYDSGNKTLQDPVADHFSHPLSIDPVKSAKTVDLYDHLLETINTKLGSSEQISACCTGGSSSMVGVRELLQSKHKIVSIMCVAHLIQLYFSDLLTFITEPPLNSDTFDDDIFVSLLSTMDLSERDIHYLLVFGNAQRKKYNTAEKIEKYLRPIESHILLLNTRDEVVLSELYESPSYQNNNINEDVYFDQSVERQESTVENRNFEEEEEDSNENNTVTEAERMIYNNSKPNEVYDKLLDEWDLSDYACDSIFYKNAVQILKSSGYSLQNARNMFKILRKFAADVSPDVIEGLKLRSFPKRYTALRWNSLKDFFEPYFNCNFRPVNFLLFNRLESQPPIALKYWLTYQDLFFMRIVYSHLKELYSLIEFVSQEDLSPFLYRSISTSGYTMAKRMLASFLDLGLITETDVKKFDDKNLQIFQESSSTATVEILDLLSVDSIAEGTSLPLLSMLLYQFMMYKSTDDFKIDFDGHFSPKDFDTESNLRGTGSASIQTRNLRINKMLVCEPSISNSVFSTYLSVNDVLRSSPTAESTSDCTESFSENEVLGTGKERLLKECIKAVKIYRLFVQKELKKFKQHSKTVADNLVTQDEVGSKILESFKRKNNLNLIIPSRYIKSGKKDIITYVLNFAQSLAIHTTSNERAFSALRLVKEGYENNMDSDLFDSYVHLHIWNSLEDNISFFERVQKGPDTRGKRDIDWNIDTNSASSGSGNAAVVRDNTIASNNSLNSNVAETNSITSNNNFDADVVRDNTINSNNSLNVGVAKSNSITANNDFNAEVVSGNSIAYNNSINPKVTVSNTNTCTNVYNNNTFNIVLASPAEDLRAIFEQYNKGPHKQKILKPSSGKILHSDRERKEKAAEKTLSCLFSNEKKDLRSGDSLESNAVVERSDSLESNAVVESNAGRLK